MVNATIIKEEKSNFAEMSISTKNYSSDEEIANTFQNLKADEARLKEQKDHLVNLLNQLETKAKEALETKKRKVDKLNSEVAALKQKCTKYSNLINSALECSPTA